jgi:transposase
MHEASESFSFCSDCQSVAAHGRFDSWRLDRNSNRRAAAAFVGMEIDGCQSLVWSEPSGCDRLDPQSQPTRPRESLRLGAFWPAVAIGSCSPRQAGEGIEEVARRVWSATKALGWRGGGRVLAQRMQRRTQTASGTQLAQAAGLRVEASGVPLRSGQQQRSRPLSAWAEKKLHRILEQSEKALLVFADESGFSLHPKLGRVWAKRGSQPTVPTTSQHHKRLNLFGWVEPLKGWHGLFRWPKGNTEGFLAFLNYLCHRVRKTKLYLYVDGAPWHKGEGVQQFLNTHSTVELEYLPPYHPELNAQERVWHLIRYEVTTNQYHATVDLIEHAIRKRQRHWKTEKIKSLCKVN